MDSTSPPIPLSELVGHVGWARALARSLVSDAASADDLVQDVLVEALQAPPRHGANPRGWMARVMRRRAGARGRRERARAGVEAEARAPVEALAPDVAAAEAEMRRRLAQRVAALDEPYRSTLLMRYWHGLEPTEIARRLGAPAGTVRWRLKVALDRLRDDLDREERGGRRAWVLALLPLASRDTSAAAAPALPGLLVLALGTAASVAAVVAWRAVAGVPREPLAAVAPQLDETAPSVAVAPAESEVARSPAGAPASAARPATPPAAARSQVRVELVANDPAHRPIAGARLSLVRTTSAIEPSPPSGPDGRVDFALPAQWPNFQRPVQFLLHAPGHAAMLLEGTVEDGAIVLGEVVLDPGGTLFGRVLAPDGRPLAGAWVRARGEHEAWDEDERIELIRSDGLASGNERTRTTRSDARGHFVLAGLPIGTWRLVAGARGHVPVLGEPVGVEAGVEREVAELRLERIPDERCIAGRVVDGQGQPVAGARVLVEARGAQGMTSFTERCDDEGAFRTVLASRYGRADLTAHDPLRSGTRVKLGDVAVGARGLELRLATPETFTLRLAVRGPDGAPAKGSRASAFRAEDSGARALNGGFERLADGSLSLVLPRVRFALAVEAPGLRTRHVGPFDPADLPEVLEVELAAEALLRGRVTVEGEPAAGARVSIWSRASGQAQAGGLPVRVVPPPLIEGQAGADGDFELRLPADTTALASTFVSRAGRSGRSSSGFGGYGEMPDGLRALGAARDVYARVELDGYAPFEVGPFDPEDPRAFDLGELALTRGGTLDGRVVSGDGTGVAGARVLASRGDARHREQVVGEDGRFRFEHLTPGPWELRLDESNDPSAARTSFSAFSGGRGEPPTEIPFNCTVSEGGTTTFELVRTAVPATLDLGLYVDRRLVEGAAAWWSAEGEAPDSAPPSDAARTSRLGVARLVRPTPGPARVAVDCADLDGRLVVARNLERGVQSHSMRLSTARLDLLGTPAEDGLWLVGTFGGGTFLRRVRAEQHALRVPAGTLRLVRFGPDEPPAAAGGTTLAEVEVAAGLQGELRLP